MGCRGFHSSEILHDLFMDTFLARSSHSLVILKVISDVSQGLLCSPFCFSNEAAGKEAQPPQTLWLLLSKKKIFEMLKCML